MFLVLQIVKPHVHLCHLEILQLAADMSLRLTHQLISRNVQVLGGCVHILVTPAAQIDDHPGSIRQRGAQPAP